MTNFNPALRVAQQEQPQAPTPIRGAPIQLREPSSVDLLLVHSDPVAQTQLTATLSAAGHDVSVSTSFDGALRLLRDDSFEVVVLSLVQHSDDLDIISRVRDLSDVPLIVLADDPDPNVRNAAFDSGADDYLLNLQDLTELDRLVRARARRAGSRGREFQLTGPGDITMHVRAHEVLVADERLPLTPKEFAILRLLLENRGAVVETDQMARSVWGHETYGSRNFVEAHISRLRRKLNPAGVGSIIATVRGIGYVIR